MRKRYPLPDGIRGLTMVSMILYHAMWDLVFIFGVRADWYVARPGEIWQQSICRTFILLSGFCMLFGKHPLRRGGIVFAAGALVSAVTILFMPEEAVRFGVLTFTGSAMLISGLLGLPSRRRTRGADLALAALSAVLFEISFDLQMGHLRLPTGSVWLPDALYANLVTAYLGFPPASFWSTDYFPVFPWIFLFWTGLFAARALRADEPGPRLAAFMECRHLRLFEGIGRHALIIYLLHQPVLYGIFTLIQFLF